MDMKIEEVLDAYVSPNREKIVLRVFDWDAVKKYKAIIFWELMNGPKQISWGQVLIPKESIAEIQSEIRCKLMEWARCYPTGDSDANISSAAVILMSDYQIKEDV